MISATGAGTRYADFRESSYFPHEAAPSQNKDRIIHWIALWPFSMLAYLFSDVVRAMLDKLYALFANAYERITNRRIPPGGNAK